MKFVNVYSTANSQSFPTFLIVILLFTILIGTMFLTLVAFTGVIVVYWIWQFFSGIWDRYQFYGLYK